VEVLRGGGTMVRKEDRGEENKDKMLLAKIESWEQKKKIMLNKGKLKEKKDERMYIDDEKGLK
jgi:hypothetical protein